MSVGKKLVNTSHNFHLDNKEYQLKQALYKVSLKYDFYMQLSIRTYC